MSDSDFDYAIIVVNNVNRLRKYKDIVSALNRMMASISNVQIPQAVLPDLEDINVHIGMINRFISQMDKGKQKRMVFNQMRDYAGQLKGLLEQFQGKIRKLAAQWQKRQPAPQRGPEPPIFKGPVPRPPAGLKTQPKQPVPEEQQVTAAKKGPANVEPFSFATEADFVFLNNMLPKVQDAISACEQAIAIPFVSPAAVKQRIMDMYQKGISGLNWYDNFTNVLKTRFTPEQANTFCEIVAAVSPRMPVERNLQMAINFYETVLEQQPSFSGFMRSHLKNLIRAYQGEELSGPKVKEFARALRGDPNAVALDTWMGKAFGIEDVGLFSKQDLYNIVADGLRELASEVPPVNGKPVEPRQFQAAVWTGIKNTEGPEHLTAKPIDQIMVEKWELFKDLRQQSPGPLFAQEPAPAQQTEKEPIPF